jgi:hypothetical protein
MLLLKDAYDLEMACFAMGFGKSVPPGHVIAAASSPTGEKMHDNLLPPPLLQMLRHAIGHGWKPKTGERFPLLNERRRLSVHG